MSSQVNWNTLRLNDTVLVETIDGLPVVLHTIADTPLVYATTERTYAGVGSNSGSAAVQNALLADGSVPLTGNLNVTPGVTIDGYDISSLGDTIGNLQAADSIARTGYTVMSHASHLVETISSSATSILIRHGIFVDTESLSVSNVAGEIEVMKVVGAGVPTVDDNGALCYRYTVQRRISTNPSGIVVGWAASTIVSGLTLRGYIAFDNRANREGTPSMRFVMHTDIAANQTEHIARTGNLRGILGYTDLDYGFAVGKLTSATKFLAYNSTTDDLRLRGADLQLDNESGELSFRLWGVPESGRSTGDISAGPQSSGHIEWMGAAKRLGIFSANAEIIYFDEIGGHFAGMITAGEEMGPNIGIGVLNGEGTIVARNRDAMAQFVLQTRSTGDRGVYLFAGNPKPEGGWLELDRTLTYDGTIRAREIQLLGGMAFGQEGLTEGAVPEIVIQDPLDVRRMGIIRPAYMGGYSVNGTDQQYLSMLLSWGGARLEPLPGSGSFVEWRQGEAFWGDWYGNHFRVEKDGRIGHFFGSTPKAWSDNLGNFSITGTVTALAGSVGGWEIRETSLTDATGSVGLSSLVTTGDDIRFWAGHITPGSAPFRVTNAGALTATNANITGTVNWANGKGILDTRGITQDVGGNRVLSTPYGGIGSLQNYIYNPNGFSEWTATNCVVTSDDTYGPSEILDADKCVFSTSGQLTTVAPISDAVINDWYCFSVWLKASSTVSATLYGDTDFGSPATQTVSVTTTWQRFYVNFTVTSTPSFAEAILSIQASNVTVWVWGAQCEELTNGATEAGAFVNLLMTAQQKGVVWDKLVGINSQLYWTDSKSWIGAGITGTSTRISVFGELLATDPLLVADGIRPAADSTTALQLQNASGTSVLNVDTTNARVGIGTASPGAKLHIDQSSTTAAIPVLIVDQADVSEEFIKFIGTSTTDASQSLVHAADMTTPGILKGWLKIYVQDDASSGSIEDGAYFIPFYSEPSS